eukprot:944713-Alexandrium_andersonii.AAC.1
MSASLVGSEMCIRDRLRPGQNQWTSGHSPRDEGTGSGPWQAARMRTRGTCLLYTSDAADDM